MKGFFTHTKRTTRKLIIHPFISKVTRALIQPNSGFPNFDLCLQFQFEKEEGECDLLREKAAFKKR